ncbi:MAG: TraR/DksA family transcriptional regulator [Myxococcales bacterium]|nr:TraR/DksA family transcriptional regulator [Myxococcales bacterium]
MPQPEQDDELRPEDLRRFRALLKQHRVETVRRMKGHVSDALADSGRQADDVDSATVEQNQKLLLKLSTKERKLLKLIDNALGKLERGEYGYCEGTGDLIAYRRLEARPWVRYSVAYQEQLERDRALHVKPS